MLYQRSPHTILVKEFSKDTGDPYYPVPNPQNQMLYEKYRKLAQEKEKAANVHFVGKGFV